MKSTEQRALEAWISYSPTDKTFSSVVHEGNSGSYHIFCPIKPDTREKHLQYRIRVSKSDEFVEVFMCTSTKVKRHYKTNRA